MTRIRKRRAPGTRLRQQRGVASIEFVFIFPVLLILFFGMVNVAHYVATARKLTQMAALMADLVARHDKTIRASDIDDYFIAAELTMRPSPIKDVRVDIYDYTNNGSTTVKRWSKSSSNGTACVPPDPNVAPISNIILKDKDAVVAVICMSYTAPVATFPGLSAMFNGITIRRSMAVKPRRSPNLECLDCR